ncbi:hypothetical protein [uncultured Thiodictyon sp.]|uniref:hypothetical protein n=1 Tax=uncultured Thiodictyon sp. TaxID=1846217 RepID=UPI0025D0737B|nr:hypothetical protein [uncultured Thiodictyon sp.]
MQISTSLGAPRPGRGARAHTLVEGERTCAAGVRLRYPPLDPGSSAAGTGVTERGWLRSDAGLGKNGPRGRVTATAPPKPHAQFPCNTQRGGYVPNRLTWRLGGAHRTPSSAPRRAGSAIPTTTGEEHTE